MQIDIILLNPLFDPDILESILKKHILGDIDIVLTDPGYLRILNKRYRHIDKTTDVLTFDLADSENDVPEGVIYVDGRLFPPMDSLLERIFHGYLHLKGFTHDTKEEMDFMNLMVDKILDEISKERSP
ncbi:MAG: rRNA maturation RNAse YbeY [FCB group bacterium]|nr:rRNA maturation RNAse YbeY [FCB group bacterium]